MVAQSCPQFFLVSLSHCFWLQAYRERWIFGLSHQLFRLSVANLDAVNNNQSSAPRKGGGFEDNGSVGRSAGGVGGNTFGILRTLWQSRAAQLLSLCLNWTPIHAVATASLALIHSP